jgi:hypothetical protein
MGKGVCRTSEDVVYHSDEESEGESEIGYHGKGKGRADYKLSEDHHGHPEAEYNDGDSDQHSFSGDEYDEHISHHHKQSCGECHCSPGGQSPYSERYEGRYSSHERECRDHGRNTEDYDTDYRSHDRGGHENER